MGHTKSKITKQTLADYTDIINHTSNTVFDKADITRENILNIIIIFKNHASQPPTFCHPFYRYRGLFCSCPTGRADGIGHKKSSRRNCAKRTQTV